MNLLGKVVALDPDYLLKDALDGLAREAGLIGWVVETDPDGSVKYILDHLNQPATVVSVDAEQSTARLAFADKSQCDVGIARLLVLRRPKDITSKLARNLDIQSDVFQMLIKVTKLMHKGLFAEAMQLALSSPVARNYGTVNCGEWLNQKNFKSKRKGQRPMK